MSEEIDFLCKYFKSINVDFIVGVDTFTFDEFESLTMANIMFITDYLKRKYLTYLISCNACYLQLTILSKN